MLKTNTANERIKQKLEKHSQSADSAKLMVMTTQHVSLSPVFKQIICSLWHPTCPARVINVICLHHNSHCLKHGMNGGLWGFAVLPFIHQVSFSDLHQNLIISYWGHPNMSCRLDPNPSRTFSVMLFTDSVVDVFWPVSTITVILLWASSSRDFI